MEQSSILSVKYDCPVARQSLLLLATAHDCETGLSKLLNKIVCMYVCVCVCVCNCVCMCVCVSEQGAYHEQSEAAVAA